MGQRTGLLFFVHPCVCSFLFLSTKFRQGSSAPTYERKFIFGIQIDNDKLDRGRENQPYPVFLFVTVHFSFFRTTQVINESANFRFLQRLSVIFGFRRDCPRSVASF